MKRILSLIIVAIILITTVYADEACCTVVTTQFKQQLDTRVSELQKKYPLSGKTGIYVKDLTTGDEYSLNSGITRWDEKMKVYDPYYMAASVIKLDLVFSTMKLAEQGKIELNKVYTDQYTKDKFNLILEMERAITISSNDAFCRILRIAGNKQANEVLDSYGVLNRVYAEIGPAKGHGTKNNIARYGTTKGGRLSPKSTGIILDEIYKGVLNEDVNMKLLNSWLIKNIHNTRIPQGVPKGVQVAHKTGTDPWLGLYLDAGIVWDEKPFIIVVFTDEKTKEINANAFIRELTKSVYAIINK